MNSNQVNSASTNLVKHPSSIYPEELLEESSGLDLKEFMTVLVRRKKLVLATTLATLLLALLATLLMKPVYRADSTIKVERNAAGSNTSDILKTEASRSDRDYFETQIQLLQTKALARRVINKLKLDTENVSVGFFSKIKNSISGASEKTKYKQDEMELLFLEGLTVTPIGTSQLLKISYDSSDPKLAASISNTVAKTFVRQNIERRFDTATSSKAYVNENITITKKSLEDAEKALNEYARKEGIVQDPDGQLSGSYTLKKHSEEIVLAEKERIEAETTYKLYANNPDNGVSASIKDPYILSLKKAAAKSESKYQSLKNKRTPSARRLRKQIDGILDDINSEINNIKSSLKTRFLEAQQKEKMLKSQLETIKKSALNVQTKNTKYNRLLREVEINQLSYNKQLKQLMEINIASNIDSNNITIIDKASPPSKKHKPNLKINLIFGTLLGLLLGMGIAFLREFTDDTIKDNVTLERTTGIPLLTQLPDIKNTDPKKLALQVALEPRSPLAESIKSLRTSLRFSTRNGAPKTIFITSSGAAEGKSTIALNLATAYSQTGSKVLLIDADLRNPSVHKLLELNNLEGLTNYLANAQSSYEDASHPCMIKNLRVITSGPTPPDPVELLSGQKMVELLENASHHYDHIIIDGPPVLGLADALVIANLAEATIVTVQAGVTHKANLLDSLKRLERAKANLLGTVLTRLSRAVNPEYDQKYYSYATQSPKNTAKVRSL